eukprot:jgi/Sobl393_1/4315/SZX67650.1
MGPGSSRAERDLPDSRSLDAWNILSFAASSYPNKLAIVDGTRTATYAQLHRHCMSLAATLHSLGITRGSRVAILHRNAGEVLALHFAAAALRAVIVNLNTALAPRELAYILADSGAEVVVASTDFAHTLAAAAAEAAAAAGDGGEQQQQQQLAVQAVVWTGTEGAKAAALPSVAGWSSSSYPTIPSSSTAAPPTPPPAAAEPEQQDQEQPPLSGLMRAIRASLDEAQEAEQPAAAAAAAAAAVADPEQQLLASLLSDFHEDYGYHMYYTSGTTGWPKGVVLSHRVVVLHALGTIMEMRLHGGDVWGHFAPLFHLVDVFAVYAITLVGGRHVLLPAFSAAEALLTMERECVSVSNVASTMVTLLLGNPLLPVVDLSHLRLLSCGGSPQSPTVIARAIAALGCEFFVSYGMTECCGKISMSILPATWHRQLLLQQRQAAAAGGDAAAAAADVYGGLLGRVCTSGRPFLLMEVRNVDKAGADIAPGSGNVGEVLIRGPTVFGGYWRLPEATAESFTPDGWFCTGDLATRENDGYITVVDRKKDMILCGGENVYSTEVEAVLIAHPAVAQAAVFGIPNAVLGELVAAAVVLRADAAAAAAAPGGSGALVGEITEWCRARLAYYKVPSAVHVVEAMPVTGSGKILKTELRQRFAAAPHAAPAAAAAAAAAAADMQLGVPGVNLQGLVVLAADAAGPGRLQQLALAQPDLTLSPDVTYVLPLSDGVALGQQVQSAVMRDARHLLLLGGSQPTAAALQLLHHVLQAAAGAEAALVILDGPIASDARLLGYALFDAAQGMPAVEAVLVPAEAADTSVSGITAPAAAAAEAAAPAGASVEAVMAVVVKEAIAELLGAAAAGGIGEDEPLMQAGVNSTLAVQLTGQLEDRLGVSLPATLVFDYPSILELSEFLATTCPEAVAPPTAAPQPAAATAAAAAAAAAAPPDATATAVQLVAAAVAELLGSAAAGGISADEPLMQAGVNSTLAVQLTGQLEATLGTSLPATLVFDYPTISEIATFLAESQLLPASLLPAAAPPITAPSAHPAAPTTLPRPVGPAIGLQPSPPAAATSPILIVASSMAPGPQGIGKQLLSPGGLTIVGDASAVVPLSRWDADLALPAHLPGELQPRFGSFLREVEQFDAAALGLTAAEAVLMDPQQRLVMEAFADVHAATAAAGLASRSAGVYVGISQLEYARITLDQNIPVSAYFATGAHLSVASGRIAYTWGLRGPAASVDTACSSSLVTAHLAAMALKQGEVDMAAAGGVNLQLLSSWSMACNRAGMLAQDGRCKTLDAAADGYVRAEAAGFMMLLPAHIATSAGRADLTSSCALLAGSAVNQDGRSSSLTAPNGPSQQAVIRAALAAGGLPADAVGLLEMHGTGTPLGDPIEVGAAVSVLQPPGSTQRLLLTGLKSEMGHAEPAAGVLGLARLAAQAVHAATAPILHLRTINPYLHSALAGAAAGSRVQVPRQSLPWSASSSSGSMAGGRLVGSVSSFAFMGTNGHTIIAGPATLAGAGALAPPTRDLRRQRMYVEPHLHPFLTSLSYSSSSSSSSLYQGQPSSITFHCRLNKPRLAYLMDHIVLGRALLPAAAMMELAAATAATLLADSASEDGSLLSVQGLTMTAPIIMPDPAAAAAAGGDDDMGLVVVCNLHLVSGQLQIGCMQEGDTGMQAGDMVVCAAATAGVVRAADAAWQQQQRLQAGALAVLSDILAPHAAAAAIAGGGEAAVPAAAAAAAAITSSVTGVIEGVSEDWHASGYFSNPRQVDSALHLGVVQPGAGAKVPVAVANLLVPAAARGAATGRLLASSAADAVTPAQAAAGVSSASYIITSDDDNSSSGPGVRGGRVPGRSSGMAAGAGELVLVIDGLQTKVPRQADLARQQRTARSVSRQEQQEGLQAAAAAEGQEEDYPCSYELDWQLSEPAEGKMAAAAAAAVEGPHDSAVRHAGKLTVLLHEEGEAEAEGAAAAAAAQAVQLQLAAGDTPAAAAATTMAVLQQVNQLQAGAAAALALQAELPSSSSKLGPGEGLQSSAAAGADATSAVWGLLRTEATEQTGITVSLLDSDSMQPAAADTTHTAGMLAGVAAAGYLEASAVRGAAVAVPRLLPVLRPEAAEHLVIQPEPRSSLSNLVARAADISQMQPLPGEVLLSVKAVGINFRDVLNVLGMYPGDPGAPGSDAAGVVMAAGADVAHLSPGDDVFGLAHGCLGTVVKGPAAMLVPMPPHLTYEEASTAPTVFVTVNVTLQEAAGVRKGERVLVHAAAGGVGLAAAQVLRVLGAVPVATAGSPSKRSLLRSLNVQHVVGSRDTQFVGPLACLGGVDVVLNSLTSPGMVGGSLSVLRRGGRFVEIGKRDIWTPNTFVKERPDVDMQLVAVDFLPPHILQQQLMRVATMMAAGQLQPLTQAAYSMTSVVAAMRLLAQASHVGKVVVSAPPAGIFAGGSAAGAHSRASVAITGGSGGLGLLMAQWLAASGAVREIHLFSRQGRIPAAAAAAPPGLFTGDTPPASATATSSSSSSSSASLHGWLLHSGVSVSLHSADLSFASDVHAAMMGIYGSSSSSSSFSKGQAGFDMVFHAAGVLQDSLIGNHTQASIRAVMAPKAAANIIGATAMMPLQQLVLFSSVASTVGAAGQANYVAANAVLDGWALAGRRQGTAVSSIQWGAWASAGMASAAVKERLTRLGQGVLKPAAGLAALAAALRASAGLASLASISPMPGGSAAAVGALAGADAAALVAVNPWRWRTYLQHMQAIPGVYAEQLHHLPSEEAAIGAAEAAAAPAAAAWTPERVAGEVQSALQEVLGRRLEPSEPFMSGGLDSLGAVEYVNLVGRRLNLQLPSTLVFDYPTVDAVTSYLRGKLAARQPAAAAAKAAPAARKAAVPRALPAAAAAAAVSELPVWILGTLLWPLQAADGSAAAAAGPLTLLPQQDCITVIPGNRWNPDISAGAAADVAGSVATTRFGAFLQDVEQFDAAAFGLGAAEAVATDPQHRLLLASAAQLLSTPGAFTDTTQADIAHLTTTSSSSSSGSSGVQRRMSDTGVFVGISWAEYFQLGRQLGQAMGANTAQGAVLSVACGRVSYHFGLKGPSMSVDTACSSSLVAAALARQALVGPPTPGSSSSSAWRAASSALVAGINMCLLPATTAMFQKAGMLAPDGRCKTMDAAADGYVRAEASAMMLLGVGTAANALAVLSGAAVNQDGRSSSLTAPNGPAQQEVLRAALADAGLTPAYISGLQMHGTGTALGDPIEIGAALQVYYDSANGASKALQPAGGSGGSAAVHPMHLVAAKSLVGHSEPGAGLTGILYAAQQAATAAAIPILHLCSPNPHVISAIGSALPPAANPLSTLAMPRVTMPLQHVPASPVAAPEQPQLALGVSGFAFQGTNAHAIISSRALPTPAAAASLSGTSLGGWTPAAAAAAGTSVVWQTSRVWVHPQPCGLISSVVKAQAQQGTLFELQLTAAHMAHVRDHSVAGRALVPGVMFMEMAVCCLQQVALSSSSSSAAAIAALSGVTIPAPCLLPDLGTGGAAAVVLRCLVQQQSIRVASSSAAARHRVHLQAQPTALHQQQQQGEQTTSGILSQIIRSLPAFQAATAGVATAAAAVASVAVSAAAAPAIIGCADSAQLDALLQLAAVYRGSLQPQLASELQVPAAAELYLSPASAAAAVTGSSMQLAAAAVRRGLTAASMTADFTMQQADGAAGVAGGVLCGIVGLQARRATAAALVQEAGVPAAARRVLEEPEDVDEDMHAQEIMYEAVQVANTPADLSAATAAACLLSSSGSSFSAAAAGLGVAQQAAAMGLPHVQLNTPAGISASPYAAALAESALPGLAKTLAAETGMAVLLQQQEAAVARIALQTEHVKGQQPAFNEQDNRAGIAFREVLMPQPPSAFLPGAYSFEPRPRGAMSNLVPVSKPAAAALSIGSSTCPPGSVQLSVKAVGINFRDVLNVLGMYPGDPGAPGGDCAGIITALAADAPAGLAVGQPVMGLAVGSLGSTAQCSAYTVTAMPPCLSYEAASSMPTVFITAQLAMGAVTGVQPGERVLVHAAAGGVGLAAAQVLRVLGAVPVATAGSPSKRSLLRSLGVQHVVGSRDTQFVGPLACLGGVDVVLNSLTSPGMVGGSLSVLRRGGRFVEIGKRDIWAPAAAAAERPDVAYSLLAVDFLPDEGVQSALQRVAAGVAAGQLAPIPIVCHNLASAAAALRQLSQASAVGKVVVSAPQLASPELRAAGSSNASPGRIIITGGLGALGLLVASWLASSQGAKHITLVSRTGRAAAGSMSQASQRQLAALLSGAAIVSIVAADVAVAEDCGFVGGFGDARLPLVGLVHASGVLEDAALRGQSLQGLRRVWAPKVAALSALRRSTAQHPQAFSLLFSSVASLMGSAGQANYAAANAALDATAAAECARGIAACSVRWGAWAGAGMASSDLVKAKIASLGMALLQPAAGLAALERLLAAPSLATGYKQLGGSPAVVDVVPFRWQRLLSRYQQQQMPELFSAMVDWTGFQQQAGAAVAAVRPQLTAARPAVADAAAAAATRQQLLETVKAAVSGVIGREVLPDEPLMAAGLDSLGSVELRNSLEGALGTPLPPTLVFDFPTAAAIAEYAASRLPAPTAPTTEVAAAARMQQQQRLPMQPAAFDVSLFGFDEGLAAAGYEQQAAAPTAVQSQQEVEAEVSAAVSSVLGRTVDSSAALMAAGLDSLGSVELQNVLQGRFAVPLPATLAIDYPSVEAMARYIHSRLAAAAATTAAAVAMPSAVRGMPGAAGAPVSRAAAQQAAAVYGAAFRMPGVDGMQQQLMQGVDAIQVVPVDRWVPETYAPLSGGVPPPRFGSFLPGAAAFDAAAFGLSEAEAVSIDPQQRLLMDLYYEAAAPSAAAAAAAAAVGQASSTLAARQAVGVYVGISAVDYNKLASRLQLSLTAYSATGSLSLSVAAGRLSYSFGLKGPSLAIDTACSSSLVAAHAALSGLRLGHCAAAAVGGVNLQLIPDTPASFQKAGMLSPEGRCKTLDASADGYVRAEAAGIILLQQLDLQQPAAAPLAILAASSVNQDGRSSSLTAPNGPAQQELLRAALVDAGLAPDGLSCLSMHGTGTSLGDPIEVGAFTEVFSAQAAAAAAGSAAHPFQLASSKASFGHAEPGAGIVGIFHTLFAQQQQVQLPIMHLRQLNPLVGSVLEAAAAAHGTRLRAFHMPRQAGPAVVAGVETGAAAGSRTGISAFAFQGTNAHIILKSSDSKTAPPAAAAVAWQRHRLFPTPPANRMLGSFSKPVAAAAAAAFEVQLSSPLLSFLWDHQVAGSVVFPGAGYIEVAAAALSTLAAQSSSSKAGTLALAAVSIPAPLVLPAALSDGVLPTLVCEISAATGRVYITSVSAAGHEASAAKMLHMTCTAASVQPQNEPASTATAPTAAARASLLHQLIPGFAAAAVAAAAGRQQPTVAAIAAPTEAADGLILHPASLDSCLQLGAVPSSTTAEVVLRVPAGIDLVSLPTSSADSSASEAAVGGRWATMMPRSSSSSTAVPAGALLLDYIIAEQYGSVCCSVSGMLAKQTTRQALEAAAAAASAAAGAPVPVVRPAAGVAAGAAAADEADRQKAQQEMLYEVLWAADEPWTEGDATAAVATSSFALAADAGAPVAAAVALASTALSVLQTAAADSAAAVRMQLPGPVAAAGPGSLVLGGNAPGQLLGMARSAALELPATAFEIVNADVADIQRDQPPASIQVLEQPAETTLGGSYGLDVTAATSFKPTLVRSIGSSESVSQPLRLVPSPRGAFSSLVPRAVQLQGLPAGQ